MRLLTAINADGPDGWHGTVSGELVVAPFDEGAEFVGLGSRGRCTAAEFTEVDIDESTLFGLLLDHVRASGQSARLARRYLRELRELSEAPWETGVICHRWMDGDEVGPP